MVVARAMKPLDGVVLAVGAVVLSVGAATGAAVGAAPGVSAVEFVVVVFLRVKEEKSRKPNELIISTAVTQRKNLDTLIFPGRFKQAWS